MIEAIIMIFGMITLSLFLYFKIPAYLVIKFPLITIVYSFSLLLGIALISVDIYENLWFQLFFILFQTVIFFITALEFFLSDKSEE